MKKMCESRQERWTHYYADTLYIVQSKRIQVYEIKSKWSTKYVDRVARERNEMYKSVGYYVKYMYINQGR